MIRHVVEKCLNGRFKGERRHLIVDDVLFMVQARANEQGNLGHVRDKCAELISCMSLDVWEAECHANPNSEKP